MEQFQSLIERLPQRELDIRRRYRRDAYFRSVCADYEEAAAALRRWRNVAEPARAKADEYSCFLQELEAEILARLDRSSP